MYIIEDTWDLLDCCFARNGLLEPNGWGRWGLPCYPDGGGSLGPCNLWGLIGPEAPGP